LESRVPEEGWPLKPDVPKRCLSLKGNTIESGIRFETRSIELRVVENGTPASLRRSFQNPIKQWAIDSRLVGGEGTVAFEPRNR